MIISRGIAKDLLYIAEVHLCGIYGLRVKANPVICVECVKWIHGRCAEVKRVILNFSRNFACECEEILDGQWSKENSYVRMFRQCKIIYLGDNVSVSGGCEAASTARTRFELIHVREIW